MSRSNYTCTICFNNTGGRVISAPMSMRELTVHMQTQHPNFDRLAEEVCNLQDQLASEFKAGIRASLHWIARLRELENRLKKAEMAATTARELAGELEACFGSAAMFEYALDNKGVYYTEQVIDAYRRALT